MSEDKTINKPDAQGPEEFTGLKVDKPHRHAAGAAAVGVAVNHVVHEMNPLRGLKALNALNKVGGFDCPGCAWPDPDDERSPLGEYCENGAKAIAEEATEKMIGARFFTGSPVVKLAKLSDFQIGKLGRISEPLILESGDTHYRPIAWDDAFSRIADFLKSETTPERSVFYTSGRTSNEAAFLYQLLVRQYGTNNLPDCSNMCHESSGVALKETLGLGKGSVTLQDFDLAEVILIIGQNPGTNHPRMLTALQKAKKKGARIISVNPLPEAGLMGFSNPQKVGQLITGAYTQLSDLHLPVRINGDVPLFKAILLKLIERDRLNPGSVLNHEFINSKTDGFDAFVDHLAEQEFSQLVEASGVEESLILKAVDLLAGTSKIISCWAMGLTQHKNAVDNIREVVNLHLLKGAIGQPGAGTCPVRGHSNVQGDRTMGIYEKPPQQLLDALKQNFQFSPPQNPGYNTVEAIQAMNDNKVDFFMAMGGNFLSAAPDTEVTAAGLRKTKLSVHVSTKLNRTHLIHGDVSIILPCLARSDRDSSGGLDQFVTVENSMGVVHKSKGNLNPISPNLVSEPDIVTSIAQNLFNANSPVSWQSVLHNYNEIRNWIASTIPGFTDFNQKLEDHPSGFYLPNGPRNGEFSTSTSKGNFSINQFEKWNIPQGHFLMMTIRSHDQFNTTIYGLNDRYRGIKSERRIVFINNEDIDTHSLSPGQIVDLESVFNGQSRKVRKFILVPYDIPNGCIATYFPECNPLIPLESTAHSSHTPTSKSVIVRIIAHPDDSH